MSRSDELAQRSKRLQLTCAAQRSDLEILMQDIEAPSLKIDRLILQVQALIKNPVVIFGTAALLFVVGPRRVLRLAGRAWFFAATARRLLNR